MTPYPVNQGVLHNCCQKKPSLILVVCSIERVAEFMGIVPNGYVGQRVDFIIFVLDLR